VTKFKNRLKRAITTGYLARETLRIDRAAPNKTVKTHHVDELQPDGNWKVVHSEREEYPAKRRFGSEWMNVLLEWILVVFLAGKFLRSPFLQVLQWSE
jgi:hypothetical protein